MLISINNQINKNMKKFIEDHAIRLDEDSATIHYKGYKYMFSIIGRQYILTDHYTGAHLVINRPTQLDRLNLFGTPLYLATADVSVHVNGKCTHANTFETVTDTNHGAGGVWVSDLSDESQEKIIERTFINVERQ